MGNWSLLIISLLSDCSLKIKTDIYKNITRVQILYTCTKWKDIDDEQHFFIYCNKNFQIRIKKKIKFEEVYKNCTGDNSTLQKI